MIFFSRFILTLTCRGLILVLQVQSVPVPAMHGKRSGAATTGGAQMPDRRFPVDVVQGVPVVTAPEEIDITNAEGLRSALLEAAADGHYALVVDMTRTRFCDSSGLHALIAAHKRAQAQDREVRLVMPGPPVLRVFALTGMDRVIPNFTTLAEALAATAATATGAATAN
jgi:anti-sigma B factor antagonist